MGGWIAGGASPSRQQPQHEQHRPISSSLGNMEPGIIPKLKWLNRYLWQPNVIIADSAGNFFANSSVIMARLSAMPSQPPIAKRGIKNVYKEKKKKKERKWKLCMCHITWIRVVWSWETESRTAVKEFEIKVQQSIHVQIKHHEAARTSLVKSEFVDYKSDFQHFLSSLFCLQTQEWLSVIVTIVCAHTVSFLSLREEQETLRGLTISPSFLLVLSSYRWPAFDCLPSQVGRAEQKQREK